MNPSTEERETKTNIDDVTLSLHPDMNDCLIINQGHQKNPVVTDHIKKLPKKFAKIYPDFLLCENGAGLFLSVAFAQSKPGYLIKRINEIENSGHTYQKKFIIVSVDAPGYYDPLRTITVTAYTTGWTLLIGWSREEVGKLIEATYELSKSLSLDPILGNRTNGVDGRQRFHHALKSIPKVNKTDAENIIYSYKSFAQLLRADVTELQELPGLGSTKAKQIEKALQQDLF